MESMGTYFTATIMKGIVDYPKTTKNGINSISKVNDQSPYAFQIEPALTRYKRTQEVD